MENFETTDLILRPASPELAPQVLDYYLRNREFLQPYEPAHDPEFFTLAEQRRILERDASVRKTKSGCRFYLSPKAEPEKIIGTAALNNIVWGCFESCHLGYKLDQQYLNRGYMTQAVSAVAEYAFESLRLHRIEANVMPRNKRSLRVLEKCGFREEGLARSYLKINGVWEDHVHMVRLRDDPE